MLTIQNYKKVESLEEAYELNQKKANRIVGGMMWMRMGDNRMNTAIDMSGLGLDKIEESDEEFKIVKKMSKLNYKIFVANIILTSLFILKFSAQLLWSILKFIGRKR